MWREPGSDDRPTRWSLGGKKTRMAFASLMGPLLQTRTYHGLLCTFHLNICETPVCYRFLLSNSRVEAGYKGCVGGGAKKNNYSCLTFPLCFSMLSSFTSFHSLKKQKMVLRPILKSLICVFYVTYCDMNQIITMAALSLVIIVEVF